MKELEESRFDTHIVIVTAQIVEPETIKKINKLFDAVRQEERSVGIPIITIFGQPEKALIFIRENINARIIVISDYGKFLPDGAVPWVNGKVALLTKVREFSQNISVIFWDSSPRKMTTSEMGELVNLKLFAFVKRYQVRELVQKIKAAQYKIMNSMAGILESYAYIHFPELFSKGNETHKHARYGIEGYVPYLEQAGNRYRIDEAVREMRNETGVGNELALGIAKLTCDLMLRNKRRMQNSN